MMRFLPAFARRLWQGAPIIVVSGLPRSGTSMVMAMLAAGGVDVVTDAERVADEDNPRGYFEFEPVTMLAQDNERSWLKNARGKAVKIISHLLKFLPPENDYHIILVSRPLREVIASQNRMLVNRGQSNPVADDETADLYARHLLATRAWARAQANCRLMVFEYGRAIAQPLHAARELQQFVGFKLDCARMAAVVDAALYRNRDEEQSAQTGFAGT